MSEPHGWNINITCPRCFHVGDATASFPCCEHVEGLRKERDALAAKVEELEKQVENCTVIRSDYIKRWQSESQWRASEEERAEAAEAKVQRLTDALAKFANKKNWKFSAFTREGYAFTLPRPWQIAEAALSDTLAKPAGGGVAPTHMGNGHDCKIDRRDMEKRLADGEARIAAMNAPRTFTREDGGEE